MAGTTTANYEANLSGIHHQSVLGWIALCQSLGKQGIITSLKNSVYSSVLKRLST